MPSVLELIELRELLLAYALGGAATHQREALEYIFGRIIQGGENQVITVQDIMDARPKGAVGPRNPQGTVYDLKRDIGLKFDEFYGKEEGNPPHEKAHQVKWRVAFSAAKGNYMLTFKPWMPPRKGVDFVPMFWKPHLPPLGVATTLYPEPIFLIDEKQTHFRNAAVGTGPNSSALSYLNIQGTLKTGYSYVPSGIVKSLILLGRTLRRYDQQRKDFFKCEPVKPYASLPPDYDDLILLSTPTSTELVDSLQGSQNIKVDAEGVHVDDRVHDDGEREKWGVLTRTSEQHRIVTMVAAKHGRSIEAIMQFLVRAETLEKLANRMGCKEDFPETFQVVFRMESKETNEGPFLKQATLTPDVFVDGKRTGVTASFNLDRRAASQPGPG